MMILFTVNHTILQKNSRHVKKELAHVPCHDHHIGDQG